jgi:hypothetical protein
MERKIISIIGLSVSICLLLACTQERIDTGATESQYQSTEASTANKAVSKNSQSAHQKPGAAVRLTHDYDGHSQVGEPETIQLSFAETYSAGELNITLRADPGLTLSPPEDNFSFAMDTDTVHRLEVSVNAEVAGKHYLHMFVSASNSGGSTKNRVFAIAFYAGDAFLQGKSQPSEHNKASVDNMIYLPSEETVIQ